MFVHLVSHHHQHFLTPTSSPPVRLSKIVLTLPPMMPFERAHRQNRVRPSCSRLRGIIPQQIAFAMLPLPQPWRFPLTLHPLFAFTLTLGFPPTPILISPPIHLPLLPLITLALILASDNHWRTSHPPKQPLIPLYLGLSLGLCPSSLCPFPPQPFPILPDPLTPQNSSLCAETPPNPPHPNLTKHHLSAHRNPRVLPTPTHFNALVFPLFPSIPLTPLSS